MLSFFGPQLEIVDEELVTIVRWRRVGVVDVVGLVLVPMAVAWGIASAVGAEELFEARVFSMSPLATAIYWTTLVLLGVHLLFNRVATLRITEHGISLRGSRFLARWQELERSGGISVHIATREDPIGESMPDGRTPSTTTLTITAPGQAPLVIRDLSEDSARELARLIEA